MVKKERKRATGIVGASICLMWINPLPATSVHDEAPFPEQPAPVEGENGEADAMFGENIERLGIDGALGQPHPLGGPLKALLKVLDPPDDLCDVTAVRKGKDHMVVRLGYGGTVPRSAPLPSGPPRGRPDSTGDVFSPSMKEASARN